MPNIRSKNPVTLSAWVVLLIVGDTGVCSAEPDGRNLVIAAGGETKAVIVVSPDAGVLRSVRPKT